MLQRPRHGGLRHLALGVRRLEAMKQFYVDVLGFDVEWEPDADNIYLSSGADNLALHRTPALTTTSPPAAPAAGSALDHFGLVVRSAGEVDAWAAYLTERGVTLDATPRTHRDGARSCYFKDPDGNSIQIIHHPRISGKI